VPSCIQAGLPGVLGSVGNNLDATLEALHGASPSSEIIVVNYADPYEFASPATIPVFGALNSVIAAVAGDDNARVADVFTPALGFSLAQFCTLDAICTPPLFDIHPTDAGYAVMADIVWQASGYADGKD
jgi:lysophospholipase L1-like esterase